ncbi:unnamed protein product [Rotaria sp. Silwood1]|nr:unnamed protein product [Rotaria sp. Silwood1]CAF1626852.1 unnamed protein product [Rotaria sp. Silwood1]
MTELINKIKIIRHGYPNATRIYQFLLALPITVATNERCFSKLKLIKNKLRSTLMPDKMEWLIISSAERDLLENADLSSFAEEWSHLKNRRSLIPVNYPFVPVHRIAVQLYISKIGDIKDICSDKICINGRCIKHSNNQEVTPLDRCEHLSEILNETIVKFHILHRIKYYHLPCPRQSPLLACFYDNTHFCSCYNFDYQCLANFFEFNSSIKHDCFGQSNCENGAKCLQDKAPCPQASICVDPKCFHGAKFQFSSAFFGLSLDAILGYHVQPHINIKYQLFIVKTNVLLTTILIIVGLINGVGGVCV